MFPIKDDIPTRRFPVITVVIIAACTLAYFVFQQGGWDLGAVGDERAFEFGAIPYEVSNPGKECFRSPAAGTEGASSIVCEGDAPIPPELRGDEQPVPVWVTLFTSMFLHGGLLHLAGNMLFLWIFGNNIEDSMGRLRYALFYLLGGLAALFAQVAIEPDAAVPTVGASGAIAAVLGGYALLYPRARVITVIFIIIFFTVVELPALVVLGLWFGTQLLYGLNNLGQPLGGEGGVAYFAHIGGFVFGLAAIKLFANRVKHDYTTHKRLPVY